MFTKFNLAQYRPINVAIWFGFLAELKANFSRFGLIVSFVLGFLLPAIVSTTLALLGLYLQVTQKRSSLKV